MQFPRNLWTNAEHADMAVQVLAIFPGRAVMLTDILGNTIYLSPEAAELFGDREEALLNRLSASLLGMGDRESVSPRFWKAIDGTDEPWRAMVRLPGQQRAVFAEASAVRQGEHFICGVIRLDTPRKDATS